MLLTTVGLAVGLVVAGVVVTVVLRVGLERASDDAARLTGQEVVLLIDAGRLPDPVPSGGTTVVQVIDQGGRVLSASAGADRLVPALTSPDLVTALAGAITVDGSRFGVQSPMRVIALPAGERTVLVAAPSGDIADAVRVVRTALILGFTVLLVVLAGLVWRLVGATLRPVEALRVGAERITGGGSPGGLPGADAPDEIGRLARTLNLMLDRLAGSRGRQRAFVADAAHELRSPLTSLRTQLEVAEQTGEPPDSTDLLAEVHRLTSLVDDLLVLATVDDAGPPPRQLVDLSVLVAAAVDGFGSARVPVTTRVLTTVPVAVNPPGIRRVLANVLDNAVRHASSAVEVTVGSAADGAAVVTVRDDGPGIPVGERQRVFERFSRLQDARDRGSGGTGLGLAIVREIVLQQGGTVALADAVPGGQPPGLLVQIRIPPAAADGADSAFTPPGPAPVGELPGRRS